MYIRKWLKLPKNNNTARYGKKLKLTQEGGKSRTIMILWYFKEWYSKDEKIRKNPPEFGTYRKWNAENEVNKVISTLKHQDILRSTQTGRSG